MEDNLPIPLDSIDIMRDITTKLDIIQSKELAMIKEAFKVLHGNITALRSTNAQLMDKIVQLQENIADIGSNSNPDQQIKMRSETLGQISKAISLVKYECEIFRSAKNFRGKEYSDIDDLHESFREPYKNHGLSISFSPWEDAKGNTFIFATLSHESNEFLSGKQKIVVESKDLATMNYQDAFKGATTRARRNLWLSLMGI